MKNVLILGANGSLAKVVIPELIKNDNLKLTLFSRQIEQLKKWQNDRIIVVKGDVLDQSQLESVMIGQDIIYANLAGQLEKMARQVVDVMEKKEIKRLIWTSSMGIYGETGEDHGSILNPYRVSADIIENSNLNYTIIRPAWFTNSPIIDYSITNKGERFIGKQVSRISIASLISKLIDKPDYAIRKSLGIAKVE